MRAFCTTADTAGMAQVHHTEKPFESDSAGCSMCASVRAAMRSPEAGPVRSPHASSAIPQGIHLRATGELCLGECDTAGCH